MQEIILAIDIGSSSVRCIPYNMKCEMLLDGKLIAQKPHHMNEEGTIDALQVKALLDPLLNEILLKLRENFDNYVVKVVGVSCFAMSLLGVDKEGHPVTPVYTYADRHAHTPMYVSKLKAAMTAEQLHQAYQRTGTPLHVSYAPATMLRLAIEEPVLLEKVFKWQSLGSFCVAQWVGERSLPISFSEASWTGLLNRHTLSWDKELCGICKIDTSKLPPLADYNELNLTFKDSFKTSFKEVKEAVVCLSIGDGACANIGSKCYDDRRIAVTVGTSAAMRVVVEAKLMEKVDLPLGLWCYRIDRDRCLIGGALTDGGSVYEWLKEVLFLEGERGKEIEKECLSLKIASDLIFLPFLSGERAPKWRSDATASLSGINKQHKAKHIYLACLEGVSYRLKSIKQLLSPFLSSRNDVKIIISGAALTKSKLWRQIIADTLNHELVNENVNEATSRGMAMLALQAINKGKRIEEMVDMNLHIYSSESPDPYKHQAYCKAAELQERIYDAYDSEIWDLYIQKEEKKEEKKKKTKQLIKEVKDGSKKTNEIIINVFCFCLGMAMVSSAAVFVYRKKR